jgi:hypothetical protein
MPPVRRSACFIAALVLAGLGVAPLAGAAETSAQRSLPLAGSTPNDGTETVTLPDTDARRARIKVQAVGGPFFDLSHANLRINFQAHGSG